MKKHFKKDLFLFSTIIMILVLSLIACKGGSGESMYEGKYFCEAPDGFLDEFDWIELFAGNQWKNAAGVEGTYKVEENSIKFFVGEDEVLSGTIEEGVVLFESKGTYRKEADFRIDEKASVKSIKNGKVLGLTVSLDVASNINDVDLSGIITVSDGANWQLYEDITGQILIPTKYAVDLANGDNLYYIVVNSGDGTLNRTYKLNVHKVHYVKITYMSQNEVYTTDSVLTHTTLGTGPTISREGYTFNGWGSEGHYVTAEKTFTADWTANKCTITFNANGGNSSHSAVDITSGDTIAFPVPTHSDENMMFLGWCTDMGSEQITDVEGIGLELWANDNTTITLYAMWRNTSCDISSYLRVNGDEANTPNPNGTHILFGEYPQTLKIDTVTMTNFQDARGYYLGSDGFYYAKVVATPLNSGYKFSDNTTVNSGTTYYFKVEPIKWRILNYSTLAQDDNKALILCESIIANKRYNEYYAGTQNGVYANNYKESEISAWLNNEFYNTVFDELQKGLIQITEVDNSAYSTGCDENRNACQNTNDKIFLPSYREVKNTEYGFSSDESRARETSDYSRATGAYMDTDSSYYGNGNWWLRSPIYCDDGYVSNVMYVGDVIGGYSVGLPHLGVVPALVIDLS